MGQGMTRVLVALDEGFGILWSPPLLPRASCILTAVARLLTSSSVGHGVPGLLQGWQLIGSRHHVGHRALLLSHAAHHAEPSLPLLVHSSAHQRLPRAPGAGGMLARLLTVALRYLWLLSASGRRP